MSIICQGITLSGEKCHRKLKDGSYCHQHRPINSNKYRQTKPSDCIICCESLSTQKRALECGHWIHKKCIIASAKAECPICRCKLSLGTRDMKAIEKLAGKRKEENLMEEEEELHTGLQYQIIDMLSPSLRIRIHEIIGRLLDGIEVHETNDDIYQSIVNEWASYSLIASDPDDNSD